MQSTSSEQARSGRAFSVFTGALLAIVSLALAFGLLHESSEPQVFGRYSRGYFTLLLALAATVGVLSWLLVTRRKAPVRWAQNAYALLVSSVVAVVLAELALRLVNPWGMEMFSLLPFHMQGMVDHPRLGYEHPRSVSYRLGRNLVSLNSNGHRDEEMAIEKPAAARRILVLGDSVTFGWGVDQGEDFPARLEALLREQQDRSWQVINSGVNGYNSEQEAAFFATDGIRFRPDIVLLVYVGNDVDPVIDPNAVTWRRYPTWPSSLPELLDRMRSLSYLFQATRLFQRMKEVAPPAPGTEAPSVTDHPRWPYSLAALKSIAALCARENIPFLVAVLAGTDERAVAALKQAGIEAISLGPAWSNVPAEGRYVSRLDPHPSAAVHAEFARQLLTELTRRGWLQAR
jgi:lysophospholipase L1-like esterase